MLQNTFLCLKIALRVSKENLLEHIMIMNTLTFLFLEQKCLRRVLLLLVFAEVDDHLIPAALKLPSECLSGPSPFSFRVWLPHGLCSDACGQKLSVYADGGPRLRWGPSALHPGLAGGSIGLLPAPGRGSRWPLTRLPRPRGQERI